MAFRPHRNALGAASPGVAQALGVGSARQGEKTSLANEEAIGRNAQGGVMMKAAPTPSFIMIEPKFLLEVLVIPLGSSWVSGCWIWRQATRAPTNAPRRALPLLRVL